jgi:hypothetical protein
MMACKQAQHSVSEGDNQVEHKDPATTGLEMFSRPVKSRPNPICLGN